MRLNELLRKMARKPKAPMNPQSEQLIYELFGTNQARLENRITGTNYTFGIKSLDFGLASLPLGVQRYILNLGMGIEVEAENAIGYKGLRDWWNIGEDGSLRGAFAIEATSPFGERIHSIWPQIMRLCGVAKEGKWDFSERTSIHIHLDSRVLSVSQVANLAALYTVFEDSLFKFAGTARAHGIFCIPIRKMDILGIPDSMLSYLQQWEKYSAMNLKTLKSFGTVEFRHMEGNHDPEKLGIWIMLLSCLHAAAVRMTVDEVKAEVSKLRSQSHYSEFAQKVFYGFAKYLSLDGPEMLCAASDAKCFFFKDAA